MAASLVPYAMARWAARPTGSSARASPARSYDGMVSSTEDILLPPGYDGAPERAVLYCDESGNSGPNYLDRQQPFYVLAGWVVPDSSSERAWLAVERVRQRISPQADELKSSSVLRGERQKREGAQLFYEFGQMGAVPLYLIAEKRYCVAGKIVETFLDPAFNPLLRNGITGDRETKQEIANLLYERLPETTLTRFAQAYRNPDADNLAEALRAIADASKEHLSPELADALLGSAGEIVAIAKAEASTSQPGSVEASLNMPCLVSFLMMAEALGRVGLHQPIRFVHDRQHAYEEGYRKIFELHRGMPRLFTALPGDEVPWGRLEAVAEFETADSKQRLPIQAADALAGVINHLMRLAVSGAEPSEADIELARLTLPGLLVTDVKVAWPIWSDRCVGRVASSLIIKAIQPPVQSETAIAKARAVAEARTAHALPVAGGAKSVPPRFKIPSPIFALRGTRSGNLMVLAPHPTEIEASNGEAQPVVPMFSTRNSAEAFLSGVTDQPEPHAVTSFDGAELLHLVDSLEECADHSEVIVFDPETEAMQHLYLPAFLESMRAIFGRIRRLIGTGLDRVVMQRSMVGGREAISMLLADGRYGAMWAPVGEVVVGPTREAALERLAATSPDLPGVDPPTLPA